MKSNVSKITDYDWLKYAKWCRAQSSIAMSPDPRPVFTHELGVGYETNITQAFVHISQAPSVKDD